MQGASEPTFLGLTHVRPAPRHTTLRVNPWADDVQALAALLTPAGVTVTVSAAAAAAAAAAASVPGATAPPPRLEVINVAEVAANGAASVRDALGVLPPQLDRALLMLSTDVSPRGPRALDDVRVLLVTSVTEAWLASRAWAVWHGPGPQAGRPPWRLVLATPRDRAALLARGGEGGEGGEGGKGVAVALWGCPRAPWARRLLRGPLVVLPYERASTDAARRAAITQDVVFQHAVDVRTLCPAALVQQGLPKAAEDTRAGQPPPTRLPPPPRMQGLWWGMSLLCRAGGALSFPGDASALAATLLAAGPDAGARFAQLQMAGHVEAAPEADVALRAWHARLGAREAAEEAGPRAGLRVGRPDREILERFAAPPPHGAGRVALHLQPTEHVPVRAELAPPSPLQRVLVVPGARIQGAPLALGDRVTLRHQRRGAEEDGEYMVTAAQLGEGRMEAPPLMRVPSVHVRVVGPQQALFQDGRTPRGWAFRVALAAGPPWWAALRPGDTVVWAPATWAQHELAQVRVVEPAALVVQLQTQSSGRVPARWRAYDEDKFHPLSRCIGTGPDPGPMLEQAPSKEACERQGGVWDRPCVRDADCPFLTRHPASGAYRGGCMAGTCEMPIGIAGVGYRSFDPLSSDMVGRDVRFAADTLIGPGGPLRAP